MITVNATKDSANKRHEKLQTVFFLILITGTLISACYNVVLLKDRLKR